MTDLKHGDKVKIDLETFLTRVNYVSYDDYSEQEIEYLYTIESEDQKLLGYLFDNNIFTIDMIDRKNTKYNKGIIMTLKELTDMDIHVVFIDGELIKYE